MAIRVRVCHHSAIVGSVVVPLFTNDSASPRFSPRRVINVQGLDSLVGNTNERPMDIQFAGTESQLSRHRQRSHARDESSQTIYRRWGDSLRRPASPFPAPSRRLVGKIREAGVRRRLSRPISWADSAPSVGIHGLPLEFLLPLLLSVFVPPGPNAFEACSGFTRVTACKVAARSHRRTLVARLRPCQSPDQIAR